MTADTRSALIRKGVSMKTNYGNWISTPMMKTLAFIAVGFYALTGAFYVIFGTEQAAV